MKADGFTAALEKPKEKPAPGLVAATLVHEGENLASTTFAMIDAAEREIISVEFLMRDDEFGLAKMALLRRKARAGKRISMHVDAFHFLVNPAIVRHLIDEGIEVTVFNRLSFRRFLKASTRNHTKLLIIDGRWVKIGDSNTGNEYVHWPGDLKMKSLDIVLDGPIAAEAREQASSLLESAFVEPFDVRVASKAHVHSQRRRLRLFSRTLALIFKMLRIQMIDDMNYITRPKQILVTADEVNAGAARLDQAERTLPTRGSPKKPTLAPTLTIENARFFFDPVDAKGLLPGVENEIVRFLAQAREELTVVSPYLILTPLLRKSLKEALGRNVRVRFYTNSLKSTDNRTTQVAYEYRLKDIAELGEIDILEFRGPETLHAKFIVRDRADAMVMTYNIDWRSERKNLESAVRLSSRDMVAQLEDWLDDHDERFRLVASGGKVRKEPLKTGGLKGFFRRLFIRALERQL